MVFSLLSVFLCSLLNLLIFSTDGFDGRKQALRGRRIIFQISFSNFFFRRKALVLGGLGSSFDHTIVRRTVRIVNCPR